MAPATTFTVTNVGVTKVPALRVKLMPAPMVPAAGATVTTPGLVAVVVNVPEPLVVLVRTSLQVVSVWSGVGGVAAPPPEGVTTKVVGVGGGKESPAGPSTPTTEGDSIARFCVSVMTSVPEPQPLCVTR